MLGGADESLSEIAFQYGRNVGLAFQLVDDLLDFVSSSEAMGKPTAADLKLGLATAPVLFACEKVRIIFIEFSLTHIFFHSFYLSLCYFGVVHIKCAYAPSILSCMILYSRRLLFLFSFETKEKKTKFILVLCHHLSHHKRNMKSTIPLDGTFNARHVISDKGR